MQVIAVPPGQHGLVVTFEHTLPRTAGTAMTWLGVLLVIGLTVASRRQENEKGFVDQSISWWKAREVRGKRAIGISLVLLVALLALIPVSRYFRAEENPAVHPAPSTGGVAAGWEAKLQIPGAASILVAVDDQALDELTKALPAGDQSKVESMVESGTVLRVPNGTKVRILETGNAKVKVRILEGSSILKEGWVSERWVQ